MLKFLSAYLVLKQTNEAFNVVGKIFSGKYLAVFLLFAFRNSVGMIGRGSFLVTSKPPPGPPNSSHISVLDVAAPLG